jgi:hypothetical protein
MSPVVPLVDEPRGLLRRYAWRYSRKNRGAVADPVRALAHHSGVLTSNGLLEMAVARGWRRLDPQLRWLALQATSGQIGCSWCADFGYYEGMQSGVDPRKVHDVPRWRSSSVYTAKERVVLEYAEAVSATPVARRRPGRAAPPDARRRRDRRARRMGGVGELPIAHQRRPRIAQSGVLRYLPGGSGWILTSAHSRSSTRIAHTCSASPIACSRARPTQRTSSRRPICDGRHSRGMTWHRHAPF